MSLGDQRVEGQNRRVLSQESPEYVHTDPHDDAAVMGDPDTTLPPLGVQVERFVLPEELLVFQHLFLELSLLDLLVDLLDPRLEHSVMHTLGTHSGHAHTLPPLQDHLL